MDVPLGAEAARDCSVFVEVLDGNGVKVSVGIFVRVGDGDAEEVDVSIFKEGDSTKPVTSVETDIMVSVGLTV